MQGFLYGILCAVIGAFMLFIGFVSGGDQVMCGSSPMEPGDTCQVLEEGGAERTYEEQKQKNSTQNLWMFGLGGVMIVGAWCGSGSQWQRCARHRAHGSRLLSTTQPSVHRGSSSTSSRRSVCGRIDFSVLTHMRAPRLTPQPHVRRSNNQGR